MSISAAVASAVPVPIAIPVTVVAMPVVSSLADAVPISITLTIARSTGTRTWSTGGRRSGWSRMNSWRSSHSSKYSAEYTSDGRTSRICDRCYLRRSHGGLLAGMI